MEDRSDENLVLAAGGGNKEAYAGLIERHYKHVFLVCMGMLGNIHDAEDVAQDAFIKGFTEIKSLRRLGRFSGWVVKIAKNLCLNLIRRKKHTQMLLSEKAQSSAMAEPQYEDLQRALAKLPVELRLPLVLYYFDGQDVKTVSERLGISGSGVYQKLRTAVKQLHVLMENNEEYYE